MVIRSDHNRDNKQGCIDDKIQAALVTEYNAPGGRMDVAEIAAGALHAWGIEIHAPLRRPLDSRRISPRFDDK
jgi:hypothetical protein